MVANSAYLKRRPRYRLPDHSPRESTALGHYGREQVRWYFLLPRLLRDELALVRTLLEREVTSP